MRRRTNRQRGEMRPREEWKGAAWHASQSECLSHRDGNRPRPRETRTPASLAKPHKRNDPWDAPGNHVFRCTPNCRELIVRFDSLQHATRLSLGVDHNDRYRLFFYRQHTLIGYLDHRPPPGPLGIRTSVLTIPPNAAIGFDAIGVVPLYGDHRYALGHLTPNPSPKIGEGKLVP